MGCDYYVFKLLRVFFNDTDYLEIQLDIERGYFDDLQFDEDADDYDEKVVEYIKEVLTPKWLLLWCMKMGVSINPRVNRNID